MNIFFHEISSRSPYETLATEQALLESLAPDEIILLVYRHNSSVIIGRNQNAWAECRYDQLESEGGRLARRISGGGAVYHDPQNVNFSFIVPRNAYDLRRQCSVLLDAVRSFGIDAFFSGRNDIETDGRKFSGNAFCFRGLSAFHHGTLLIDTDQEKMSRFLAVSPDKIRAKGVSSVRSRTVNLKELNPRITPDAMTAALRESFSRQYGRADDLVLSDERLQAAECLAARNAGWEWIFGRTPHFDIEAKTRFPWGGLQIQFSLDGGCISRAGVFSDAMDESFIRRIGPALSGKPFQSDILADAILSAARTSDEQSMAQDAAQFLLAREY